MKMNTLTLTNESFDKAITGNTVPVLVEFVPADSATPPPPPPPAPPMIVTEFAFCESVMLLPPARYIVPDVIGASVPDVLPAERLIPESSVRPVVPGPEMISVLLDQPADTIPAALTLSEDMPNVLLEDCPVVLPRM